MKKLSPQQQNRILIHNYHCKAKEHLYLNPKGKLIESYESGYTLIKGVYMEDNQVLFSGTVHKHK